MQSHSLVRRIIVNLYMTMDGFGEFPKYPGSDFVSEEPDALWTDMWASHYDSVDTVVFGRRAFEDHLNYHSEAARKPGDPKYLYEFSRWLDGCQKVCLSHFMKETKWQNSRIMSGELSEVISTLKNEPGKDIIVDGGPSVVQEVIQRGLADEYWLLVMPVILGRGKHYWGTMLGQQTMKLLSVKTLPYGELLLHYQAVR
ncbi:MAG: dihydrofolate reductase family protein [Nitrososphaerota archaeon]|nr:dihydrofolate reductase family protein [Nitrososphaerota archaeon]